MKFAIGLGTVAFLLAAGPEGRVAAQKEPGKATNPLNEKVLGFAKKNLGEQVGNGECWTLANDALKAAGAKSSSAYQDSPNKGD